MKKIMFFLMLIVSVLTASAQDVIVKKDGSTILSKVLEIGSTEVKYKKWNNLNGPIYTIFKSEIQVINYHNGLKETFTNARQPQREFDYNNYASQMANSMAANNKLQKEKLYASAKSWNTVGSVLYWVCFIGGAVTGVLVYDDSNQAPAWIAIGGGTASGVLCLLICKSIANNKENAANSISSIPLIKQNFDVGIGRLSAGIDLVNDTKVKNNGIGIGLRLNF